MIDWKRRIRERLSGLGVEPHRETEIVEEVAQHLEQRYEELRASGFGEQQAQRAALAELSDSELLKRELRRLEGLARPQPIVFGARRRSIMGDLWQDLRYGSRVLRKSPGFTAVAVLSLALGIGANTAIFTLINAVMLKSLPVYEPERLVLFSDSVGEGTSLSTGDPMAGEWRRFSYPSYEYFRDHNESFESLCAFRSGESRVSVRMEGDGSGDSAQRAFAHLVTGNFFSVLGVNAVIGRTLTTEDDSAAARPAAVISYGYWKERCNSDSGIIGKSVTLNRTAFTIVGVTPKEFFGVRVRRSPDYWLPLSFQPDIELQDSNLNAGDVYWLNLMGRLNPGIGIEQAQTNVNVAFQQFLTAQAGAELTDSRRQAIQNARVGLKPGGRGISGLRYFYSEPLKMLMAIVVLVLLIACANVGNLLLSRSAARQMEISMRLALGASPGRLVRQLLTESVLLAALGGLLGMVLAKWGVDTLVALVSRTSPIDVRPDAVVLGFTVGISLMSGVIFGLAPALRASRSDLSAALKEGARAGGRRRSIMAPALVVSQVALSLVLLVGAGLFGRSLLMLQNEDLGFNRENVLLVDIDPRIAGYKATELPALYRQLLDRLGALPGARSVSLATYSPISGTSRSSTVVVQGHTSAPDEDMDVSDMLVGPNYCETLGLPLLLGREIGLQDTLGLPKVAMVNEAFAEYFFPGENPIGRRFSFDDDPKKAGEIEIVGVIGSAKYHSAKEKPTRAAYQPILQHQDQSAYSSNLEIRTEGDPLAMASDVRSAITQVDAKLPIVGVTSLNKQLGESLRQERLIAQLVSFFGLLALVLACVGLYGVMAHSVVRRTNEIGIRMALGAERGDIVWMVLRETLILVSVGIVIGGPAAVGGAALISSQLYGLSPADPLTLVIATVFLAGVAALAGYLPARRASRVDPLVALRYE